MLLAEQTNIGEANQVKDLALNVAEVAEVAEKVEAIES